MTADAKQDDPVTGRTPLDLSDADIYEAMAEIPGYLDITTEDFRQLYRLAFQHALTRMAGGVTAARLMSPPAMRLAPAMTLEAAVRGMAATGVKGVPVVAETGRVLGVLTETDLLRHCGVATFPQFLAAYLDDAADIRHTLHDTRVAEIMSSPAVTVTVDTGFAGIVRSFRERSLNRLPVVDERGVLQGVLSRKDFIHAFHLEDLV